MNDIKMMTYSIDFYERSYGVLLTFKLSATLKKYILRDTKYDCVVVIIVKI